MQYHPFCRWSLIGLCLLAMLGPAAAAPATETSQGFLDAHGRHFIPRGYVNITEDKEGPVFFTPDDYRRMVRMGANMQVIRLNIGKLGGWPGLKADPAYLDQVAGMVRMGKEAGIETDFKMTVYGTPGFDWTTFWKNQNGEHDCLLAAWQLIWERFKDEPAVFGYDLLNEPMKGELESYEVCESQYLVPLLRRLIDAQQQTSPRQWALYQPILKNNEDRSPDTIPFIEMQTPIERDHIIFAPHTYEVNMTRLAPTLDRYAREAALSHAPMMLGEWGSATLARTDLDWDGQIRMMGVYRRTVEELDARGLGAVKAWFCGSRAMLTNPNGRVTWAIFRDARPVGTVERKYIIDMIVRPYPAAVQGAIKQFGFDFATRVFTATVRPESATGTVELFIPVDRHYPDGFSLLVNDAPALAFNPLYPGQLTPLGTPPLFAPDAVTWDGVTQRLVIHQWPEGTQEVTLNIYPGWTGDLGPTKTLTPADKPQKGIVTIND